MKWNFGLSVRILSIFWNVKIKLNGKIELVFYLDFSNSLMYLEVLIVFLSSGELLEVNLKKKTDVERICV